MPWKSKTYESSLYANKPVGGQDLRSYHDDCAEDLSCKGICDVRTGYLIPNGRIFWWDQALTFKAKSNGYEFPGPEFLSFIWGYFARWFWYNLHLILKNKHVDISVSVIFVGFLISVFGSPESWSDIATNIYSLAAWPVSIGTNM